MLLDKGQTMDIKGELRKLFYDKAPNALVFEHISYAFPHISKSDLEKALNELVADGFLITKSYPNKHYPKFNRTGYHISSDELGDYPVETEIVIGDFKIPRLLDGDVARSEDINCISMSFEKVINPRIEEVKRLVHSESRKYWGMLITIFGIFIALFTLINAAVKPVYFSSDLNLTSKQIFFQTLYNIGPLAVLMFLFVWALYFIFRQSSK